LLRDHQERRFHLEAMTAERLAHEAREAQMAAEAEAPQPEAEAQPEPDPKPEAPTTTEAKTKKRGLTGDEPPEWRL